MKRWVAKLQKSKEVPEIDAFLKEILEVCKRHGLSIGHQDGHGAFEVSEYNEDCAHWLLDANDVRSTGHYE